MYLRPQPRQTQRTADLAAWPAPTAGLIANRNLATPDGAPGATILENWMPTAQGAVIRRGSELYATVGGGQRRRRGGVDLHRRQPGGILRRHRDDDLRYHCSRLAGGGDVAG